MVNINTQSIKEGSMSDIDIIAQEAKDFKDFVKEFYKEYTDFAKTKESLKWLEGIYKNRSKMEGLERVASGLPQTKEEPISENTLSDLEKKLKSHDWWYAYSDDNRKYTNGRANWFEITKMIRVMKGNKEVEKLWNKYVPKDFNYSFKELSETQINESSEEILMGLKQMAMTDLERIGDYAEMIADRMEDGQELSSWMYSKITLAVDQLNSVHDTMDGTDGIKEAELPKAMIPGPIKAKLTMAINKIKDTNLSYPQKLQVIAKIIDSLGIDKKELVKISSRLKGTLESVNEGCECGCDGSTLKENIEPQLITQLRGIVKNHQNQVLKDPKSGKKLRVDVQSASTIVQVYDALKNPANKEKFVDSGLVGMQTTAFKLIKR